MQIVVNGETIEVKDGLTVAELIAQRYGSDAGPGIAVAIGDDVLKRNQWASTVIRDGNQIEILSAVQGG
ncbi:sulfur carrier protein ThiS [Gardnerella vaginalis]|uniref:sulfur carrier protein ThiS n=1 Tax=Gardnerella vaginalis TaxID=2702 RepID=UPI001FF1678F|nr:sulfur carrier protein ThiS [Gardnerella vaginalis]